MCAGGAVAVGREREREREEQRERERGERGTECNSPHLNKGRHKPQLYAKYNIM